MCDISGWFGSHFFFFKQKTAYEMRISDWSSDVCSSDLPALQSGLLRCIGSTTYKEYRSYFEKDRALVRRFQKIDIMEPSIEDTVKILRGLKPYYEDHHNVRFTNEAIRTARSEEHTSELQSLMRISYAVFCLKKKNNK